MLRIKSDEMQCIAVGDFAVHVTVRDKYCSTLYAYICGRYNEILCIEYENKPAGCIVVQEVYDGIYKLLKERQPQTLNIHGVELEWF